MSRNLALTTAAGKLRNQGLDAAAIFDELCAHPDRQGLPEAEVRAIANSIGQKTVHARREPEPGQTFRDAVEELAWRRGWTVDAMKALGARPYGQGCAEFPMVDAQGAEVGARRRRGDNAPLELNGEPVKAWSRKGGKSGLLKPQALPEGGPVLIVEGEADTLAALSAGHPATVGTPGAMMSDDCIGWLQSIVAGRDCVLAPDPGEAGQTWLARAGAALVNAGCGVRFIPALPEKDLDDRLRHETDKAEALAGLIEAAVPWKAKGGEATPTPQVDDEERPCPGWEKLPVQDPKGAPIPLHIARRIYFNRPSMVNVSGDFWQFDGQVYREQAAQVIDRDTLALIGARSRKSNLGDVRHLLAVETYHDSDFFEAEHGDLIALANGMLDTRTRELLPHNATYRCRNLLPVAYDAKAVCPRFREALDQWHPGDAATQEILCMWLGLCLVKDVSFERLLVLVGEGANGKGRYVRVLENLLGKANISGVPLTALRTDRTFPAAALVGKLVNLCPEAESSNPVDEGFLKALVSGDTVEIERKNRDPFPHRNTARFVLQTNNPPHVNDKSDGFWRRLLVVKFEQRFRDGERDPELDKKLEAELPGILNLALLGLEALRGKGYFPESDRMREARQEYRKDCNPLAAWADEALEAAQPARRGRVQWVSTQKLFESYRKWCVANGHKSYSRAKFGKEFKRLTGEEHSVFRDDMGRAFRGFGGWRLINDNDS